MPSSAGNCGGAMGWAYDFLSTFTGPNATLAFDNAHPRNSQPALKVHVGSTGASPFARWNSGATSPAGMFQTESSTVYGAVDAYFTSNPGTTGPSVLALTNASGSVMAQLRVLTSGLVTGRDSTNLSGASATTTTAIALNQWVRIEWKVVLSATVGQIAVRLFNDPTSATPTETVTSAATLNTLGPTMYGAITGVVNSAANNDFWLANARWSDIGYPTMYQEVLSRWVGAVTPTAFTVTARVVNTSVVRLKVSTASDLLTSPAFSTSSAPDANGVVKLTISGLAADTAYFYGLELDGTIDTPMNGKARTYPVAGSPASFSFWAASCARNFSNHAVFDAIRTRTGTGGRPALFGQHLGDMHYRDIVANDQALMHRAFDEVQAAPRQQRLMAEIPMHYTWSDHDSGGGPNNDGTAVAHAAAQAAYRVRVPSYPLEAADNAGIYFSYVIGRVRFIVTDGRSYASPIAATDDASKTKLGTLQKEWLKSELLQPEPVKVWFHEDSWITGATFVGDDTWNAYGTERAELAGVITANHVNVVIPYGDIHILGADSGVHTAGGVPVFVCAPLDQTTFAGNGTYSAGTYPAPPSDVTYSQQYGWFNLTDDGAHITIAFTGYDSGGTARITKTVTFDTQVVGGQVWNASTFVRIPSLVYNGTSWVNVPSYIWNGSAWVSPA
jgi:alkaline phosphatase D